MDTTERLKENVLDIIHGKARTDAGKCLGLTDFDLCFGQQTMDTVKILSDYFDKTEETFTVCLILKLKGGGRSYKPIKKDTKNSKIKGYKEEFTKASASVNRQALSPLAFVVDVERSLQAFATAVETNAEDALIKTMISSFTVSKLDEMKVDVSKKGGSSEGKIVKYAGRMFGLQSVVDKR